MDDSFVIETDRLTKRYSERVVAVNQLTMGVRAGEVYGFLGPNGSGKTTTLRMLLGLVRPTAGRATVLGAAPGSSEGLARIGAMIESPAFYPFLSGRDNLRVVAGHARVPESRIAAALDRVDLTARGGDRFRTYSQGMKQRLGVAAALLKDPALLVLDEPTNGLDPAGVAEMRDLIREFGRGGRAVLVSSHIMTEIEHVSDRVGIIRRGSLVAEGTLDELRGRDEIKIRAEPVDRAHQLVAGLRGIDHIALSDGWIRVAAKPDLTPAITAALVNDGVAVSEVRIERASLEDVFLNVTRNTEEAA